MPGGITRRSSQHSLGARDVVAESRRGHGLRRARAVALKAASARWWSFSPRSTSTCSVKRPRWRARRARGVMFSQCDVAQPLAPQAQVDGRVPGAARQVDDRARERLVEWGVGVAEPPMPRGRPGSVERLSQGERAVLGGVVVVDLEVALAGQLEVEAGVAGPGRVDHVVEEAHPGGDARGRSRRGRAHRRSGLRGPALTVAGGAFMAAGPPGRRGDREHGEGAGAHERSVRHGAASAGAPRRGAAPRPPGRRSGHRGCRPPSRPGARPVAAQGQFDGRRVGLGRAHRRAPRRRTDRRARSARGSARRRAAGGR